MTVPAGIEQQAWVKAETTFDTQVAETATDAVNNQEFKLEPERALEPSISHVGTGSLQEQISRKKSHKWSIKNYVRTSAAGTAPDIGPLLIAAMGDETIVGGTSATYAFNDTAPSSLQFVRKVGSPLYELGNGGWVESMEIDIQGNSEPSYTFSGGYARHGKVVDGATVDGAVSISATAIPVAAGTGRRITPGAGVLVAFGAEDNGGAGYQVTSRAGDTLTITPGLAAGLSGGEAVTPLTVTQTLAGSIRGGIDAALILDAVEVGFISGKVSVTTGIKGLDKEANTDRVSRILRKERREVSFEGQAYFDSSDLGAVIGATHEDDPVNVDLELRIGPDVAGSRCRLLLPAIPLMVKPIEVPDQEELTWLLSGRAQQSAVAGDELSIVYD